MSNFYEEILTGQIERTDLLDQIEEEIAIREARRDPSKFCEYALSTTEEPVHIRASKILDKYQYVIVLLPKDHGKTLRFAIGRSIWLLGKNPNIRIKIVGQKDSKAIERVRAIKHNILYNERVHKVFPDLQIDTSIRGGGEGVFWVKRTEKVFQKDPSVEGVGLFSSGVGGHCDILIADDVCEFRNTIQIPALRKQTIQTFQSVWLDSLQPNARVIYMANPWHTQDLTHELQKNPLFKTIKTPIGPNFEPVAPKLWPRRKLIERFKLIGQREFDRAFRLKPISTEDQIFKSDYIESCKTSDFVLPSRETPVTFGVDLSLGESDCKTAIFILAKKDQFFIPIKVIKGKFSSPQTAKLIVDLANEYQPVNILVENNQYQGALIQWINAVYPAFPYTIVGQATTGLSKYSLRLGLMAFAGEFEKHRFILPKHDSDCNCDICSWIKDLEEYPIGETDDVMASWLAWKAFSQESMIPSMRLL